MRINFLSKKLLAEVIMKRMQPLVSVIMPVHNAGEFVAEAIESILKQTYRHIEFIIVDDASIDKSWTILKRFKKKDSRIRLYRNDTNLGVSRAVKRAIGKARGNFIARMDADDICFPTRLEKELAYLQENHRAVAVGGQCDVIDTKGKTIGAKRFPINAKDVYEYIFTFVPIQQPTLMIAKKRLPNDFEYYVDGMNTAEEIELLFKLFQYGNVENLPETVLKYRIHGGNTSLKDIRNTFFLTLVSRIKAVLLYGYRPSLIGVGVTIIESLAVLVLPHRATMWLYTTMKKLFEKNKPVKGYRMNLAKGSI